MFFFISQSFIVILFNNGISNTTAQLYIKLYKIIKRNTHLVTNSFPMFQLDRIGNELLYFPG